MQSIATKIRKRILDLAYKAGPKGAHLGGNLSLVEILLAIYNQARLTNDETRDRVILSKGHGAMALLAVLEEKEVLTKEEVDSFEENGSHFYAHTPRIVEKGLEFAGGSLSLGLSFSVGVALACKKKKIDNQIFVIVGDGELNEGLSWESIMSIANYGLNNVTIIVDANKYQLDGSTQEVMNMFELKDKFSAFRLDVYEVDGHNISEIESVLHISSDNPKVLIANTIKGKGVSFCENNYLWHHNVLSQNLYEQALKELEE